MIRSNYFILRISFHHEKIELLEGPSARIFGPNAFSGAVNIITTKGDENNSLKLNLSGGQYGYYTGTGSGSVKLGRLNRVDLTSGHYDLDSQRERFFFRLGIDTRSRT